MRAVTGKSVQALSNTHDMTHSTQISTQSEFKVAKTASNDTNFFHLADDSKKPVSLFQH